MNKKIVIIAVTIIIIVLIILGIVKVFKPSDNEFATYSLNNINITNPNANLIFVDDIDGTGQEELIVNKGFVYSFNKHGEQYTIKVLKLTDEYITISINGLAPSKETGGFSLVDNYDKVTIKKNTGICLNIQATDLNDGSFYFFYVKK